MTAESARYVGRFAPSPTGPLHLGSLLAAVASYLQARVHDGRWLLRIENIDPPREDPEAAGQIVAALDALGFEWDGSVIFQSESHKHHASLVDRLVREGRAYPCTCSRRELADAERGPLGTIYPGNCREGCRAGDAAIRLRTYDDPVGFDDRLQGYQSQRLESESGDFVIRRRDGLIAYHLAVAVDDVEQGVTEVVRGIDLMDSTQRQLYVQACLGMTSPDYTHIPVATDRRGQKLSKSTGARAIETENPAEMVHLALEALRQHPPQDLSLAPLAEIWAWATANWDVVRLKNTPFLPVAEFGFG